MLMFSISHFLNLKPRPAVNPFSSAGEMAQDNQFKSFPLKLRPEHRINMRSTIC